MKRFKQILMVMLICSMVLSSGGFLDLIAMGGTAYGASADASSDISREEGGGSDVANARAAADDAEEGEKAGDTSGDASGVPESGDQSGSESGSSDSEEAPATENAVDAEVIESGDPVEIIEDADDGLVYQEIEVTTEQAPLYIERSKEKKTSKEVKAVRSFWKALTGRKAENKDNDETGEKAPVKLVISGNLPEGATAEASYIEFGEEDIYNEQILTAFDITIFDKDGNAYIPEEPVTVTVSGRSVKSAVKKEAAMQLYSYAVNDKRSEKYSKKYDKNIYAADVLVFRDRFDDDKRLEYKPYDKKKKYKDGEDAVRYYEDETGLVYTEDDKSVLFDYTYGNITGEQKSKDETDATLHFVLSQQLPEDVLKKNIEAKEKAEAAKQSEEKAAEPAADAEMEKTKAAEASDKAEAVSSDAVKSADEEAGKSDAEKAKDDKDGKDKEDSEKPETEEADEPAGTVKAAEAETKQVERVATDGKTYRISAVYETGRGIPENAILEVKEIRKGELGYNSFVKRSAEEIGKEPADLSFVKAFDITFKDPVTDMEYQPDDKVKINIELLKDEIDESGSVDVVHFGDKVEVMDTDIKDGAVEFETDGFSVFVVAGYTVDFHWGEYTYNLEGNGTIFLSELLQILAENGKKESEEPEILKEIAKDMSRVKSVKFSDSALLKVEKKGSEQAENDWLLTSLKAFDTEETLTIKLTNGEEIVIRVTDAQRSNDAEGTFKVIERSNGNSSQQKITYWDTFAEAAATVNSGVNYPATIEILDLKENGSYEIDSTVSFTKGNELTIIGNGHTLSRKDGFTGTLISRAVAGTFTIGNLTIDNGTTLADGSMISKAGAGALKLNTVTINGGKGTGSLITISAGPTEMNTVTINRNGSIGIGINNTGAGDLTLNNCIVDGSNNTEAIGSLIKMGTGSLSLTDTVISAHTVSAEGICAVDSSAANGTADIKIYSSVKIIGNTSGGKPANLKINGTNRMYVYNNLTQDIGITSTDKNRNGDQFGYMGTANITGIEHLKNDQYSLLAAEADGRYFKWAPDPSADNLDVMFGFPNVTIDDLKTYPSAEDLAIVPEGALPGTNNEVQTNPYMVWKSVKYNDDNTTDITLNYYEKQVGMKLDFIFVIDETGTMHDNKTANGYKQSQAMWARYAALEASKGVLELNNTYPKSIYGTDNRVRYISFADNKYHDTGFMNNYDTALANIGYDFSGTNTYHSVAINAATNACSESRSSGHEPIVVYLSDYQAHFQIGTESSGNTYIKPSEMQALQNSAEAIYAFLVYETYSGDPPKRMSRMTPLHYWMADKNDPSTLITPFVEIVHDAVARCGKTTNIQDALANGLIQAAAANTVTSSGSPATNDVVNENSVETWNLLNGTTGDNRLYTGTMYTKVIHIPMTDDVYAGGMPTNQNLKLYDDGEAKNEITDSPILRSPVTLLLKGKDNSGSTLSGATFTLTRGSNTWNLTTDANGRIVLPWGENDTVGATTAESTFAFPVGAEYTLTQNTTVSGYVRPAGSWNLKVGSDYKITATASQGSGDVNRTRNMEAHSGKLEIYNDASPKVIYHYNQPTGTQTTHQDDQIEFAEDALSRSYTLGGIYNTKVPGYVFTGWALSQSATDAVYQEGDEITLFAKGTGTEPDSVDLYAVWAKEGDLVPLVIEKKWDESIDWTKEPYASQKAANSTIEFKVYGKTDSSDSGTLITAYTTAAGTTQVSTIKETDSEGSVSQWAKKVYVPKSVTVTENNTQVKKEFKSYSIEEVNLKTADGTNGYWEEPSENYQEGIDKYVEKTTDQLPEGVKIYQPSKVNSVNLDLRLSGEGSITNITSVTIEYSVNNGQYYFQTKANFSSPKKLESSYMGKWEKIYQLKLLTNSDGYKPVFRKLYINGVEQQVGPGNWISSAVIDTGGNITELWTGTDMDVSGSDSTVTYYIHEVQDRKLEVTNSFTPCICKIVGTDNVEHCFPTLNSAVNYARAHGNGQAMSETNPVTIEMLVDYEVPQSDKVTLDKAQDNITITTAATSGGEYNFTPTFTPEQGRRTEDESDEEGNIVTPKDSAEVAILKRGWQGSSNADQALFYINNDTAALTTQNILLEGADSDDVNNENAASIQRNGRAVYVNKGGFTIKGGSTFRNFITPGNGGAIYDKGSVTTIGGTGADPVTFRNCKAYLQKKTTYYGGAVYTDAGTTVNVSNTQFYGLEEQSIVASYGGALYINGNAAVTIDGCQFQSLSCSAAGGAVYQKGTGDLTVENTTFGDDSYASKACVLNPVNYWSNERTGGSIHTESTGNVKIEDSNFYGYGTENNTAGNGGAVYIEDNAAVEISGCIFKSYIVSGHGGAIYQNGKGTLSISDSTFGKEGEPEKRCMVQINSSTHYGGAIYTNTGADVTLTDISVYGGGKDNKTACMGGALYVNNKATVTINKSEFNNLAVSHNGGAVYLADGATMNMTGGTVTENTASNGGAVYLTSSATMNMTGGTITENTATNGGAVYLADGATMNMTGGTVTENTASNGGAVYLADGATMNMTGGTVTENTASNGGAVYLADGATMSMNAGTISGNTATLGAGIYLEEGSQLQLSVSPGFGGTTATGDGINTIGTGDNAKRQDIYIAGYLGKEGNNPKLAQSLIVTGALNLEKGSIWVGAEVQENQENNHWDTLKQFAKFDSSLIEVVNEKQKLSLDKNDLNKTLVAFRNATTSEEYYGSTGDAVDCIYWDGVRGSRKVILRKVKKESYSSIAGAEFTVHRSSNLTTAYVNKVKGKDDETLQGLTSGESGVFWIGMLPYGTYVLDETKVPSSYNQDKKFFYLVNDEDGVVMSEGYTDKTKANSDGIALFDQRKSNRKPAQQG